MLRYAFVLSCLLVGIARFVCQSHTSFPWGLCFVAAADYFLIFEKKDPLGFLSAWTPIQIYWCGIFLYCMARLCWRAKFFRCTFPATSPNAVSDTIYSASTRMHSAVPAASSPAHATLPALFSPGSAHTHATAPERSSPACATTTVTCSDAPGLLFWVLFSMICPPVAYLYITLADLRFFCIRPKTMPVKKQQKAFALGLFFLLLCDLCVVLSFPGLEAFRSFIWVFYVPALVFLTYADTLVHF